MDQRELRDYLENKRIAIIDDSRAFVLQLQTIVRDTGANLIPYFDPNDFLNSIESSQPDVIVCDLEMPDLDGYTLVRIIRGTPAFDEVPVLMLTARDDSDSMVKAVVSGADAFVAKSAIKTTFLAQLMALVRLRELHKALHAGKQLMAIQSLIGTYKHEFGNSLAIMDAKLRKLERTNPQLSNDDSFSAIKIAKRRFEDTLEKLNSLRKYEEDPYVGSTRILKIR